MEAFSVLNGSFKNKMWDCREGINTLCESPREKKKLITCLFPLYLSMKHLNVYRTSVP